MINMNKGDSFIEAVVLGWSGQLRSENAESLVLSAKLIV